MDHNQIVYWKRQIHPYQRTSKFSKYYQTDSEIYSSEEKIVDEHESPFIAKLKDFTNAFDIFHRRYVVNIIIFLILFIIVEVYVYNGRSTKCFV